MQYPSFVSLRGHVFIARTHSTRTAMAELTDSEIKAIFVQLDVQLNVTMLSALTRGMSILRQHPGNSSQLTYF